MDVPATKNVLTTAAACLLLGSLVIVVACSRAGGGMRVTERRAAAGAKAPQASRAKPSPSKLAASLARAQRLGDFPEFTRLAQEAAGGDSIPFDAEVKVIEGLFSGGRLEDAEQLSHRLINAHGSSADAAQSAALVKLFFLARLRQGKSPRDSTIERIAKRLVRAHSELAALLYFQQQLGAAKPYQIAQQSPVSQIALKRVQRQGSEGAFTVEGIEARFNGNVCPLVFIDTGAQYTVISTKLARAIGLKIGAAATQLVGFSRDNARPAIVESLQIGSLEVRNVPVYVADTMPMESSGGDVALGTDLMFHVRFTIDYREHAVQATAATNPIQTALDSEVWKLRVWTLPQLPLVQATGPDENYSRVLVDTGNRAGTYVSGAWLRRIGAAPRLEGTPRGGWLRRKPDVLPRLTLGGQVLADWPVTGFLPAGLERADLVDVLIGHDLLAGYRVTIDLAGASLYLESTHERTSPRPAGSS